MSELETKPGTLSTTPPPDLPPVEPRPEPAAETPPARPTTRAGREALRRTKAAEKAAAKGAKAEKSPAGASKPPPRRASLESRLAGSIASVGTGLAVAGAMSSPALQADGLLVVEHSPHIAKALDKLAKDNPAVAAALERMLTAGAWSGVIAACVPVALGIAANHGAIPAGLAAALGAGAPEEPAPVG